MHLVKFKTDDSGEVHPSKDWHLVGISAGSNCAVCTGEFFGMGESGAEYKEKFTGKITCPDCIALVKLYQSIKL